MDYFFVVIIYVLEMLFFFKEKKNDFVCDMYIVMLLCIYSIVLLQKIFDCFYFIKYVLIGIDKDIVFYMYRFNMFYVLIFFYY